MSELVLLKHRGIPDYHKIEVYESHGGYHATRKALVDKYREKFRDEEPVVTQGLYSKQADLVYPIVSDIPVMLIDEALPGSEAAGR